MKKRKKQETVNQSEYLNNHVRAVTDVQISQGNPGKVMGGTR